MVESGDERLAADADAASLRMNPVKVQLGSPQTVVKLYKEGCKAREQAAIACPDQGTSGGWGNFSESRPARDSPSFSTLVRLPLLDCVAAHLFAFLI